MRAKRKKRGGAGAAAVAVIVFAFLVVMTVQIYRIKAKDDTYAQKEEALRQEYADETQRTSELDELETYMNSSEYVEDVAKSKLGLTYENEIIFKEEK